MLSKRQVYDTTTGISFEMDLEEPVIGDRIRLTDSLGFVISDISFYGTVIITSDMDYLKLSTFLAELSKNSQGIKTVEDFKNQHKAINGERSQSTDELVGNSQIKG